MKKIFSAICSLLLLSHLAGAASAPQQEFEKGNQLFNQKQYSEAATVYQGLIDQGYEQPELFLNAGNAWYKANKTGMAIFNYEMALARDPFNKSATHNLSVANQRVEGYVNDLPLLFFQRWWLHTLHFHSPDGWATGAVILLWLAVAAFVTLLIAPSFRPVLVKWVSGAALVLFLFYLSMGISAYVSANAHDEGIIMGSVVKVKAAPDDESKDMFELHEGVKVQVTDATQEYCKISLPDGKTGWLACAEIKRL
ncbi:SH3 domain-containing protein [Chitinophaga rhizophila]|uniref:SH3 domain-containing protein n=1 Tax=Chitinophaga rhizophila TaxID=2866212 RepID=A0ABS7GED5_9BACT|nr:SH3 domain-containing protein [Chitinophaga rhizophila]MBW8686033.1 SH3 domain-containing protein [Chitinophaga rhizophila]